MRLLLAGNRAQWGGAVILSSTTVSLALQSTTAFVLNRAIYGGAVYSESSNITVAGRTSFLENSAFFGGAIQAMLKTKIGIKNSGYSEFQRNFCDQSGGGAMLRDGSLWNNEGRAVFRGLLLLQPNPFIEIAR